VGSFAAVLDDPAATGADEGADALTRIDPGAVRRILLCSGKVAFDAMARRQALLGGGEGLPDPGVDPAELAVVRTEQLYPWPEDQISDLLASYPAANEVVWLQEEPENMGAWSFVHGRLHRLLGTRYQLRHVSRPQSGSPATGSSAIHQLEHEDILERSVGPLPG